MTMKKNLFFAIIIAVILSVAIITIISTQIALQEEKERLRELEALRDRLLLDNERLTHDLEEDITDAYIIRKMREMGYYFPGEKQITFVKTPTTTDDESEGR